MIFKWILLYKNKNLLYKNNVTLEGIINIYSLRFSIYDLPVQFMAEAQPMVQIKLKGYKWKIKSCNYP